MSKLDRRMSGRSSAALTRGNPYSVTRDFIREAASALYDMKERLIRHEAAGGELTEAQRRKRHQLALAGQHVNFALYFSNTANWPGALESLRSALSHARLSHVKGATVAVREALDLARGLKL